MKLNKELIVIITVATLIIIYIIAIIYYSIEQIKINNYFKSNISKIVNEGDAYGTKMLNDNTTGYTNNTIGYKALIYPQSAENINHQYICNNSKLKYSKGNYNTSFGNEKVLEIKLNGKIGWIKGNENTFYSYNVLIGEGVGKNFTHEEFCVIVGHDSIAVNAQGKDMMWIVNWNEPYLLQNPEIKTLLEEYDNSIRKKALDSPANRIRLVLSVQNTLNKSK